MRCVLARRYGGDFHADETEVLLGEKLFDRRKRHAVLLRMKQEIAALARAVEVDHAHDILRCAVVALHQLAAEAPDLGGARAISFFRDLLACGYHAPARDLAVERDPHKSAGTQQREQHAPSRVGVGQVMQHADRLDQVETPLQRAEPHDVGLCVFDVETELACPGCRIGKARPAQIDRERARALMLLRGQDRVLAGAAARDENVQAAALAERVELCRRKQLAQICVEIGILSLRPRCDPARIGLASYCVCTARETSSSIGVSCGMAARSAASSRGARTCWSSRGGDRRRPGAREQRVRCAEFVQRKVGRNGRDL